MLVNVLTGFLSNHLDWAGIGLFLAVACLGVRGRKKHHKTAEKLLKKSIDTQMNEPLTLHPEVNPALCAGCGACTKVCPEGDILKLIGHQAVLVSPSKCVGHGECELACPTHAITLVFGTKTRGMDIPRINTNYETNVPGLYIAGELGGMGLIRNAVKQGALAANHAVKNLTNVKAEYDLVIIGGGPAGLSASLEAISQRKNYLCLEQNSLGGTVYNFPRQKIVMTAPTILPIVGQMKFKDNKVSKEELLDAWDNVRRKTGLRVEEKVRFDNLEQVGNLFKIKTSRGEVTARKVILALGVRGSPRKLGLPNEDLPKVTYNLIDPEQYQQRNIVVVGGGNAGVEAAQMLGDSKWRNQVTLLVRGPQFDRCNDENKKIITEMATRRQVQIWFNSNVQEIHPDRLLIRNEGQDKTLDNDFLFIFAGAELPSKMLMSLGIQIDKKFGEALKSKTG
ncbi:MAG: NAD(P)-binding domain-containing protein [Oligoflexia bacterium]|nr:NAD(P)-binding domain-containing protein [Oligoflexia bacterium]